MSEKSSIKKNCPACNSAFICNHSNECWCASFEIPPKLLTLIRKKYKDCLCKDCLFKLIENVNI